jgi:hypothetical protein
LLTIKPACQIEYGCSPLPLKNSISSKPFTPEEFQAQNPLPLNNSKLKTLYPWRIPSSKHFTPEEFQGSLTGGYGY